LAPQRKELSPLSGGKRADLRQHFLDGRAHGNVVAACILHRQRERGLCGVEEMRGFTRTRAFAGRLRQSCALDLPSETSG
jgi:hypothetical protein